MLIMLYYIFLYNETPPSYGDYVEAKREPDGGLPVANDPTVCIGFRTTEELHQFAKENGINEGEYAVHGFWEKQEDNAL